MQFGGLKHEMLNRVLGGIARHPNIGGYLIVGLGCEQSTIGYLVESQRLVQIDGVANSSGENTTSVKYAGPWGYDGDRRAGYSANRQITPCRQ